MTSHTNLQRPVGAHRTATAARIVLTVGIAAIALTLTACDAAKSVSNPAPASPTASPTPTVPPPSVHGTLAVQLITVTKAAVLPQSPSYAVVVNPVGGNSLTSHPVDPSGAFVITLPPGTYDLVAVQIQASNLGPEPIGLPLTSAENLRFEVPATGCVYGGHIAILYGRLPAGTIDEQAKAVGQLHNATGQDYKFVFLPEGGFVVTGGKLDIPPASARPAPAQSCPVKEFASVPA